MNVSCESWGNIVMKGENEERGRKDQEWDAGRDGERNTCLSGRNNIEVYSIWNASVGTSADLRYCVAR